MFKKNDPLVNAVQKVMAENAVRYQVEQKLCEELGIYSKNALPNEHKANFDALLVQRINEALHPNQKKLDVAPPKGKLTGADFAKLRKEEAELEEGKWNYDKSMTAKVNPDDPRGVMPQQAQNRAARKIVRQKIKAKAHKELMSGNKMNEALHPNQQKLDVHEPEKDKLTAQDFKMLRSKKKQPQGADYAEQRRKARMADTGRMDEAEEGGETREGGAVTDTKGKAVVSPTAMKAEPEKTGPSASDRGALTNKIKSIMKEAKEKMEMDEAAKSKSQQRLFGAALATRRGESEPGSRKIAKLAADVSEPELKKFAGTKLKGLPEKKKVSESEEISFDSVMEEIAKKLGKAKMKEIEEEEDPNKPYEDKPLSPGDTFDARQTADKMQSTPGGAAPAVAAKPMPQASAPTPAPAPAAKPAPAAGAAAPDNRSGLQKFFGMKATGRNAPAPTGPAQTVAQQASSGQAAGSMRNVAASLGQNAADKANGTQNVVKPGEADAAAGRAAAPRPETGAGLSKVSNPDSPEVKAKVASVAANDAARSPVDVDKAITGAANVEAPAPVSGLDKPAAKQSFGQAFAAARKAAGGAGGSFKYTDPKTGKTNTFQTNVKGEKYQAASKLKPTGMRESLQSTINNVLKG